MPRKRDSSVDPGIDSSIKSLEHSPAVPAEAQKKCNLFVCNLPPYIGDADLYDLFTRFGNIISAQVIRDRETKLSKCFGMF